MRTLAIYEECDSALDFREIKSFIKYYFGSLNLRIIKVRKKIVHAKGIIFDPVETEKAFLHINRRPKDACSIVITDKIFATFDNDKRPHIRAAIYSDPSVISLSGIVEGPAKPKEFYTYKQHYHALGVWQMEEPRIKMKFKNQFIDYQDKRLTEVVRGYISQAIFFCITGNPFCEKRGCRLFNAHWQKDLIYSQITHGKFCSRHKKILYRLKKELLFSC